MRIVCILLALCCLMPAAVHMRMAPQMNPNDIIRNEEDPLGPNQPISSNRPKPLPKQAPVMPPAMPQKQVAQNLMPPQMPQQPQTGSQVPQNPQQPQQPQLPQLPQNPQPSQQPPTQQAPQQPAQQQPPPQAPQLPQKPQSVQSQAQTQAQARPMPQTRAQPELRRQVAMPQQFARQQQAPPPQQPQPQMPMQMPVPALVMIMPNHQMPLLLPGGQSINMPQPHLMTLTPGPPPMVTGTSQPTEDTKSGELKTGFNPWNLGLEELQALVNQFKTSVVPTPELLPNPNAGQAPAPPALPAAVPAAIPTPVTPENGQQPPLVLQPLGAPNPAAPNEVKTDEAPKPREGDNPTTSSESAQNGTQTTGEANRRRSVMHNPVDQQHNTIETRFSQSPSKMNLGAVCEGVAAVKAPACVAEQKWDEIMRQEIDCGLQRKREWRCYCGFFEGDEQQSLPQPNKP